MKEFLVLPFCFKFKIRGAPGRAIVGVLSVVVELLQRNFESIDLVINFVEERYLYAFN